MADIPETFLRIGREFFERGITGYYGRPMLVMQSLSRLYSAVVAPKDKFETEVSKICEDLEEKGFPCLTYLTEKKREFAERILLSYPETILSFVSDVKEALNGGKWEKIRAEFYLAYLLGLFKWKIEAFKELNYGEFQKALILATSPSGSKYVLGVITAEQDSEAEEIARYVINQLNSKELRGVTPIFFTLTSENKGNIVSKDPAILRLFMAKALFSTMG